MGATRSQEPLTGERPRCFAIGTRLYVWQVIDTVRESGNSVGDAAAYLGLHAHHVQAAVNYYADFTEEVDEYRTQEREFERRERERFERAQRVLG